MAESIEVTAMLARTHGKIPQQDSPEGNPAKPPKGPCFRFLAEFFCTVRGLRVYKDLLGI